MFHAKQILEQLMQATQGMVAPSAGDTTSTQQKTGIGGILSNPAITGALSGAGGGLLAGLLLGNKKVRSVGGKVAAVGGVAALGAIAFTAYRNWQTNKGLSPETPVQNMPRQPQQVVLDFDTLPATKQEDHSLAMLTAIVAAAKSDGHFDEQERQIIHEHIKKIGDAETTAWVQQEIYKPLDIGQVAAMATSPELAAEIYLASLIIIDEQNERERIYLDALAEKLKLEPQLRMEIEHQLTHANR